MLLLPVRQCLARHPGRHARHRHAQRRSRPLWPCRRRHRQWTKLSRRLRPRHRPARCRRLAPRRTGLEMPKLRTLFLTHLHSDHTLGLPDLIFTPWVLGPHRPSRDLRTARNQRHDEEYSGGVEEGHRGPHRRPGARQSTGYLVDVMRSSRAWSTRTKTSR